MSATPLAVRRLLHSKPGDPPFGIYKTVRDEDGKYTSRLRLREFVQRKANAKNREYQGEASRTKIEAETSAARVFWEDPRIQERAAKLAPSKKARRQKKRCAQRNAERKARRYGTCAAGS